MLEKGEISKSELLVKRFVVFFRKYGINIDPEEFNEMYQVELGNTYVFNDHGYETVKELKNRGIIQFAVTNGTKVAQNGKLRGSGLDKLLDEIFISEDIGFEKPDKRFFEPVIDKLREYGIEKNECVIVGDSDSSDIQGGINAGIRTVHYTDELKSRADAIISDLSLVLAMVQ